ncbi:MAG: hypothetical protein AAGE43_11165 [Pseudomonadota bacterium]
MYTLHGRPLLAALVLLAAGCSGPLGMVPGGELAGDVVVEPVSDWSFASDDYLALETRPDDPYSVNLNYIVRDGALYLDPAEGRSWLDHLRADPRVRVRLNGKVYPLKAVLVAEPGELEGFESDRYVYRLDPRD